LNHDFVGIARELQPLKSLGVYHAGMRPPGSESLPAKAGFDFDPPIWAMGYKAPQPVQGVLLGLFGVPGRRSDATHALLVNLDYSSGHVIGIRGSKRLELFDPTTRQWQPTNKRRVELPLSPGGGKLIRIQPEAQGSATGGI